MQSSARDMNVFPNVQKMNMQSSARDMNVLSAFSLSWVSYADTHLPSF